MNNMVKYECKYECLRVKKKGIFMKTILLFSVVFTALLFVLISCDTKNTISTTQETTPVHIHTEETIPAVESTCLQTGLSEGKKCSDCGEIIIAQQEISTKPHTEIIDEAVEATCTSTGLTEGKHCSVCDTILIRQNKVSKVPHNYDETICTNCGDVLYIGQIYFWVSTTPGVQEFIVQQIEKFKEEHPEYNFDITIHAVDESAATSEVLKDLLTAPDMYFFVQYKIDLLVQSGSLTPLTESAVEKVRENSIEDCLNTVTVDGKIYAYPMLIDNTYEFIGCKPQNDSLKSKLCSDIALYLTTN